MCKEMGASQASPLSRRECGKIRVEIRGIYANGSFPPKLTTVARIHSKTNSIRVVLECAVNSAWGEKQYKDKPETRQKGFEMPRHANSTRNSTGMRGAVDAKAMFARCSRDPNAALSAVLPFRQLSHSHALSLQVPISTRRHQPDRGGSLSSHSHGSFWRAAPQG
jgi:hypothetical protein